MLPRTADPHPCSPLPARCSLLHKRSAFTLIELLVVIAIIAILAGLAFPAISGAIKSSKKAEVRSMANQIKLALSAYYAEYGIYPTNITTDAAFLDMMTGVSTNQNRRGIRFLEVSGKFIGSDGNIVTPDRFLPERTVFRIKVDTNYDGRLVFNPGTGQTNMNASIAVWVADPTQTNKVIGTW